MQQSGTDEHCFYLLFSVGVRGEGWELYESRLLCFYQKEDCGLMG